jgi:uncharacterized membrane protein (UPF0127 family)
MSKRIGFIALFLCVIVAIVCVVLSHASQTASKNIAFAVDPLYPTFVHTKISFGKTTVDAAVADTEALRTQGLSGSAMLPDGHGMLFVFPKPGLYSFWMKDMQYPIDMIWITSDKKVSYIENHATPDSYPQTFVSDVPSQYVVEVPDGFAKAHDVRVGDEVALGM